MARNGYNFQSKFGTFNSLPEILKFEILKFLPEQEIGKLYTTSSFFKKLIENPTEIILRANEKKENPLSYVAKRKLWKVLLFFLENNNFYNFDINSNNLFFANPIIFCA